MVREDIEFSAIVKERILMPTVARIYRTGSKRHYTVALDCGHTYVLENAMVKDLQLRRQVPSLPGVPHDNTHKPRKDKVNGPIRKGSILGRLKPPVP